jgi:hypothetical protein
MNDKWHLTPLGGSAPLNSLAFYDDRGRIRYYSTGHQWFFDADTGKPAFYADGKNMYWAEGKPILLNIDKTLLEPLASEDNSASAQYGSAYAAVFGGRK